MMRYLVYKEIRHIQRSRGNQTALSESLNASTGGNKYYLTTNEVRKVLEEIDIGEARRQILELYGCHDLDEEE